MCFDVTGALLPGGKRRKAIIAHMGRGVGRVVFTKKGGIAGNVGHQALLLQKATAFKLTRLKANAAYDADERPFALPCGPILAIAMALLHKSAADRTSPFPGQIYPATSVMGVPSAVKPLSTATRTWNSAT